MNTTIVSNLAIFPKEDYKAKTVLVLDKQSGKSICSLLKRHIILKNIGLKRPGVGVTMVRSLISS